VDWVRLVPKAIAVFIWIAAMLLGWALAVPVSRYGVPPMELLPMVLLIYLLLCGLVALGAFMWWTKP
jgi:hypothetical protein